MNRRGLLLSAALHTAAFLLVFLGPAPRDFRWEPQDAIAVNLVSPVPLPEPPVARPEPVRTPDPLPPPVPDPVPEPEPEPEPEVKPKEDPPPAPAPAKTKPRKPPRRIQRVAPRRDEDTGPSLAERLFKRLNPEDPAVAPADEAPEAAPAPAASTSAEVDAQDFPFAWYLNVIRTRITDAWDPPGDRLVVGRSNRALVHMRIHRDGRVSDVRVEASGNGSLDASAQRAVKAAQPFPPLPESWEGDVLDVGIRFTVEAGS